MSQTETPPLSVQDPQPETPPAGADTPGLRRSTRSTAGVHSNPYNLPQSATNGELNYLDPQVLANISQTQLILVQMLSNFSRQAN